MRPLTKTSLRRQLKRVAVVHQTRLAGNARPQTGSTAMNDSQCSPSEKRGLLIVGVFKLLKALFFISIGAGALHLVHKNLGDLVVRLIDSLPIDPEGRVVSAVMDKADLIDAHDLRRIGAGAFIYAVLCVIEGTGLLLRKTWAEYFTVILTVLGLPIEMFELIRRYTLFKVGALVTNIAVLLYLLWVLKTHQRQHRPEPVDC